MNSGAKRKNKRVRQPYTRGELNTLIDSLCHPLFESNDGFILVDGFLHGLVEQDPPSTVRKFMKYNLPRILEQMRKRSNR